MTLSSELTSMRFHFKMICPVLSFYCQKLGTLPNFDLEIIVLPTEKKKKLFEVLLFVEYCNRWLCKILSKWPRPQVRAAPKAVLSYTQAFRRFLFCSWMCVVYVFHQKMPGFLPDSTPPCQYHSGSQGELAAGFVLCWRRKIIFPVGWGEAHCAHLCKVKTAGENEEGITF